MARYSLAETIISIKSNDSQINSMFGTISIGGEGSTVGSINTSMNNDSMWSTEGFATGGWVHSKNLDRTGSISVDVNQLAPIVSKLKQLYNVFFSGEYDGFTITVSNMSGQKICTGDDCYLKSMPAQNFASSASSQTWTFTCGKLTYN